ncbi:MAG: ABC transporter permease [Deltaproteobacteria bacterium]|nr:ABC transporter permease [Deltaproteobacteria bacterium]
MPNRQPRKYDEYFKRLGSQFVGSIQFAGGVFGLGLDCMRELVRPPFYVYLTIEQMFLIGVRSFLLVAVTALATGSVMALQFGYGLQKFGGQLYVPKLLALAFVREMGPVFTSLLVAARIGSGITAEVGSMNVTQQIDAIRALGTNPIKRIVIPRLLATVITLPILTVMANFIGIFGGMLVTVKELGQTPDFFFQKAVEALRVSDFFMGFLKPVVFAIFIALTACYRGMRTSGGTKGVGDSTTWVVVTTNIFIMVSDFFLTKLFILVHPYQ